MTWGGNRADSAPRALFNKRLARGLCPWPPAGLRVGRAREVTPLGSLLTAAQQVTLGLSIRSGGRVGRAESGI